MSSLLHAFLSIFALVFQPAASSPSSRSVRHFALPPGLQELVSVPLRPRGNRPEPNLRSCAGSGCCESPSCRPPPRLQPNRTLLLFIHRNQLRNVRREHSLAVSVEGVWKVEPPRPERAGRSTYRGGRTVGSPVPVAARERRTSRPPTDARSHQTACDIRRKASRRRRGRRPRLRGRVFSGRCSTPEVVFVNHASKNGDSLRELQPEAAAEEGYCGRRVRRWR